MLEDLRHQGWNITPYLVRQKWENFVQIKERVYPLLVRDFYYNAELDDFKTGIVTYVDGKEIHLTKELFAEALEIPTNSRKLFQDELFEKTRTSLPHVSEYVLKDPSSKLTSSNLLDHVKILHKICVHNQVPTGGYYEVKFQMKPFPPLSAKRG